MHVMLWVAALSLLCAAAAMGVIAWRNVRGARERESARVELLKALAFPDASAVPVSGLSIPTLSWTPGFLSEQESAPAADARVTAPAMDARVTVPAMEAYEPAPEIFGERPKPLMTFPRWIPLAAVGAAMFVGVRLYVILAGVPEPANVTTPAASPKAASMAPVTTAARTTAVPDPSIELIALDYKFGKATAFDVNGVVRNPADGQTLPQLMAVVNLLDADGRILTSKMTPLQRPVLEPGQTSAFSLVFPRVSGTVANYQVEFRLHGRDTVPQIDLRAPESAAKTRSF